MLLSGNGSLPALNRRESSTEPSLEPPRTPTSISGIPQTLVMLPPRHPTARLDEHGARIRHRNSPPAILECPMDFLHCRARFTGHEFGAWLGHSLEHFRGEVDPPRNSRCVFCWTTFDSPVGMESWHDKLACTMRHHLDGKRLSDAPSPDYALHNYLWEKGILTTAEWKDLVRLRTETSRRGRPGVPGASPPISPIAEEPDQQMVVMTTNPRRDRRREQQERTQRRLEEQVRRDENEEDD